MVLVLLFTLLSNRRRHTSELTHLLSVGPRRIPCDAEPDLNRKFRQHKERHSTLLTLPRAIRSPTPS
jgi:hypothetical protein